MASQDDETVRLRVVPRPDTGGEVCPSRRLFIGCAVCAGLAAVAGAGYRLTRSSALPDVAALARPSLPQRPSPKPPVAVSTAGEAGIAANRPADIDVFRFDRNPQILVLDFASMARQGAMLNRLAAMIEKNGQPHDRALDDAMLDQAIRAGGDTPETFYYGHDYGAVSLTRFFATVDRQKLPLTSDELWLRDLLNQQAVFSAGGGAAFGLISVPAVGAGASRRISAPPSCITSCRTARFSPTPPMLTGPASSGPGCSMSRLARRSERFWSRRTTIHRSRNCWPTRPRPI